MNHIQCKERGYHKIKWKNVNHELLSGKCIVCNLSARMHILFFDEDFTRLVLSILSYYYRKSLYEIPSSIKKCIYPSFHPSNKCTYIRVNHAYYVVNDKILQKHHKQSYKEIVAEAFCNKFNLNKDLKRRLERKIDKWFCVVSDKLNLIFNLEDYSTETVYKVLDRIMIDPFSDLGELYINVASKKMCKLEVGSYET